MGDAVEVICELNYIRTYSSYPIFIAVDGKAFAKALPSRQRRADGITYCRISMKQSLESTYSNLKQVRFKNAEFTPSFHFRECETHEFEAWRHRKDHCARIMEEMNQPIVNWGWLTEAPEPNPEHANDDSKESAVIELLRAGTRVLLGGSIVGQIIAVMISNNDHIQYQISYWANAAEHQVWLLPWQFKTMTDSEPPLEPLLNTYNERVIQVRNTCGKEN